ncbi:OmpA domain protein [Roseobacter sp. SK209-2-6]|nr:OmpA domain protein [Roseobacter sp. SK209-2-6]
MELPGGAESLSYRETAVGSYALPLSGHSENGIEQRVLEGRVLRRTWRLPESATALQILAPLREQLQNLGYETLFQCQARQCGGFDFRFGIEVVPAPDMLVSLSDYEFLSAAKPLLPGQAEQAQEVVSLLVSHSGYATFLQIIETGPVMEDQPPETEPAASSPNLSEVSDEEAKPDSGDHQSEALSLSSQLLAEGHVILEGLVFKSGSVRLGQRAVQSLEELAQFLKDHPEARVLIVGHTDSVGSLASNRSLSERRAEAVRGALIENSGIDNARVQATGVGYAAPIASNLSPAGREKNRRVEAVLLSSK